MEKFFSYDNRRDTLIDALKGTAIILVVLGHAIQYNLTDFDSNIIFKIIYSFHMPLFMFLSGYLSFNIKKFDVNFLVKKFKSLVIPFVLWYIISYWVQKYYVSVNFIEYITRWIKSPDYGLWFLWVLFLNFCLLYLFIKLNKYLHDFAFIIGIFLVYKVPITILGVYQLKWYIIFFIGGYLVAKYMGIIKKYKCKILIISIVVYPIILSFWKRVGNPTFTSYIIGKSIFKIMPVLNTVLFLYRYLVPFMGIIIVIFIINSIKNFKIYNFFCWIGKYTIDIYIFHFFFLKSHKQYPVNILITFSVALLMSLIFSFIFRKFKFTRITLLGQTK